MSGKINLFVEKRGPDATLPTRGSSGAAGYDLYASKDCTVAPHDKCLIPTDIAIELLSLIHI